MNTLSKPKKFLRVFFSDFSNVSKKNPIFFSLLFMTIFIGIFSLSVILNVIPGEANRTISEYISVFSYSEEVKISQHIDQSISQEPVRIIIERVGINDVIVNPSSTKISVLDSALRNGVVHYPGSGALNDDTNLFLFAHSSGLPVVINSAYKIFNNLKNLQEGDEIKIQSENGEYVYVVRSISLVDAEEAWVELGSGEKTLTLSTCNSFGKKQERYVVRADFLEANPI